MNCVKIGLGTSQFGLKYGISNSDGIVPSDNDIDAILSTACLENLCYLDTAQAYGNCEERLSKQEKLSHFKIVTKLNLDSASLEADGIQERVFDSVLRSKNRLTPHGSLHGVLIHNPSHLLSEQGKYIWNGLQKIKEHNFALKIGISVYSKKELDLVLKKYKIDMVQLPLNLVDQTFADKAYLSSLKAKEIEVHSRSCFLQGLLLMEPHQVPTHMNYVLPTLTKFWNFCNENKISKIQGALAFIKTIDNLDCVIIGFHSVKQLKEIVAEWKFDLDKNIDFRQFSCSDERIIHPSKWGLKC